MLTIARNAYHADPRSLPKILMLELGYGHIEMRAQAVFEAAKHLPLVLERASIRYVNFQAEESNWHGLPHGILRGDQPAAKRFTRSHGL